ncbi:hypothetical protein V2J09_010136 [Rumex salicifolius]
MDSSLEARPGFLTRVRKRLVSILDIPKKKVVGMAKALKKNAKDDPRRAVHSLKMALALMMVSTVYCIRPLYNGIGVSGMWAILTVIVVFEFTVGATISRCLNRGFATLLAGSLGMGVQHFASLFGEKGEPIVLGTSVFILATFTRFIPRIKARYDYGILVFILTFSMVVVSGYRVEDIVQMASLRIMTIMMGGAICLIVCICIRPSILTSKASEDALANFMRWEPYCNGRFRLCSPWKQYRKIGTLARECAYQLEALRGYINPEIMIADEFRRKIQDSCTKTCIESSKALREASSSLKTWTNPKTEPENHVERSKEAVKEVERILKSAFSLSFQEEQDQLFALVSDATVVSILISVVDCVARLEDSVHELAKMSCFVAAEPTDSQEIKPAHLLLHRGIVSPVVDDVAAGADEDGHVIEMKHVGIEHEVMNPSANTRQEM